MVYLKLKDECCEVFFVWLIGKLCDIVLLLQVVQDFIWFKEICKGGLLDVFFQMLIVLEFNKYQWCDIVFNGGWYMVWMNFNIFVCYGVFEDVGVMCVIVDWLCDVEVICKVWVFFYQLMVVLMVLDGEVLMIICEVLYDVMEVVVGNVLVVDGSVVVCLDVFGFMCFLVMGFWCGLILVVCCVDVVGLVIVVMLCCNLDCQVFLFEYDVCLVSLEVWDIVVINVEWLVLIGGGGMNCFVLFVWLNCDGKVLDLVLFVLDNQFWIDVGNSCWNNGMEMLC